MFPIVLSQALINDFLHKMSKDLVPDCLSQMHIQKNGMSEQKGSPMESPMILKIAGSQRDKYGSSSLKDSIMGKAAGLQ